MKACYFFGGQIEFNFYNYFEFVKAGLANYRCVILVQFNDQKSEDKPFDMQDGGGHS